MNHIETEKLLKYGRRELPPEEFLTVHRHVEKCTECRGRLKEMLPAIIETEEKIIADYLRDDEEFHLDYENHLKPFVMKTADAVTCEIVESHIEVCAECRGDLLDLMAFHESLEAENAKKAESNRLAIWEAWLKRFLRPSFAWLGAFAVLGLTGGAIWYFWQMRYTSETLPTPEIVKNQTPLDAPEANKNTEIIVPTSNFSVNAEKDEKNSQVKPTVSPTATVPKLSPLPEKNAELPPIETAKLKLPAFLNELQIEGNETSRGGDNLPSQKIDVIAPNGNVIRDSSPFMSWKSIPNIENYEVLVLDEKHNPLFRTNISGNSWRVPNLPTGKIYYWQVTAKTFAADGKTQNYLGQGKFYIVSQQDENKINRAKNALERGRAFAEAGLLAEAAREFRKYLKENPNSENAKKFLRQVEQAQR